MNEVDNFLKQNGISIPSLKRNTLNIAKANAPVDTGNLRQNAITRKSRKKLEWTINYSSSQAYYVGYLNEGKPRKGGVVPHKHKGFIERTYNQLMLYMVSELESNKDFQLQSRANAKDMARQSSLVNRRSKMLRAELETQRESRRLRSIERYTQALEEELTN